MERDVYDKHFTEKRVPLDGRGFYRCKFTGCTFIFAGREMPYFEDCGFENIRFKFVGSAEVTRMLLSVFYRSDLGMLADGILDRPVKSDSLPN